MNKATRTREQIINRRNEVFVMGFLSGRRDETSSARYVGTLYPTFTVLEVEYFLNGQDDGRANDFWRLDNMDARKLFMRALLSIPVQAA